MKLWNMLALSILCGLSVKLAAQESLPTISLGNAKKLAAAAQEHAAKNNWRISVAIVNAEGNLIYFERADGSARGSIDASVDKAKSANAYRRSTKVFADEVKNGRVGLTSLKDVVAVEGGLPITINGVHVGGIGISGAHAAEDEACAAAALAKL